MTSSRTEETLKTGSSSQHLNKGECLGSKQTVVNKVVKIKNTQSRRPTTS